MPLRTPPPAFVDLAEVVPGLVLDIRYHTHDNFTGAPIPGYGAPGAWAVPAVAQGLVAAQAALAPHGYGLVMYDAYRPQRSSRAMVQWIRAQGQEWLLDGWISPTSRHNRGIAVDVGLVHASGRVADMGGPFDAFEPVSHTENATGAALVRRLLLRDALCAHGFRPYFREWWHFELAVSCDPHDVPYGTHEPDEAP